MKNYNEMANDVLRRIGEHENKQRDRRNKMKKVILPACCFCLVAFIGISLSYSDFFGATPSGELENSSIVSEEHYTEPEIITQPDLDLDVIGLVVVDGVRYEQCLTNTKTYTPDKYLGKASDFEGTYQTYLNDGPAKGLYISKEDPNVLMVELKHDEYIDYVILIKE